MYIGICTLKDAHQFVMRDYLQWWELRYIFLFFPLLLFLHWACLIKVFTVNFAHDCDESELCWRCVFVGSYVVEVHQRRARGGSWCVRAGGKRRARVWFCFQKVECVSVWIQWVVGGKVVGVFVSPLFMLFCLNKKKKGPLKECAAFQESIDCVNQWFWKCVSWMSNISITLLEM